MNLLKNKYNVLLLILYSLILLSFNFIRISNYDKVILYIVSFILCFGIYSLIFFRNKNSNGSSLKEILFISIFLRVIVIFVNPVTTDDHYRYLWDGLVQSEGVNPYIFSPLELTEVQDEVIYPHVSYPEIRTIYPPVSQILFFISNKLFGHNVFGLKIFYLLFEIGILIFLFKSLKLLNINSNFIYLYALSPLIIFEFFINAHIDIVILFFLIGSIYFALKINMNLSMLFLGFSVLSKIYSLIFLPIFILYFFKKNRNIKPILISLLFFLSSFLIIIFYTDGILNIFLTMNNYMRHWYSNNLLFKILESVTIFFGSSDHTLTRIILLILFSISYLFILFSKTPFIQKIYLTAFCYLLFSHTVHPWYLALLVLMLPLYFNYTVFYWSGIIGLTNITVYYYLKNNVWSDFMPVLIIEYVVLLILFYKDIKIYKKNSTAIPENIINNV